MKFLSIPLNGSTWSEPLIYSFDTELDERTDVEVEIYDVDDGCAIAHKRLYGVVAGSIDIAPILRSMADMRIADESATTMTPSPIMRNIRVSINELESEQRQFCSTLFDIRRATVLSLMFKDYSLSYGDKLIFTAYAPNGLQILIDGVSPTASRRLTLNAQRDLRPQDVVVNTRDFAADISRLDITIHNAKTMVERFSIKVGSQPCCGQTILWRSAVGAVESYLFPRSINIRKEATANRVVTSERPYVTMRGATVVRRLYSSMEPTNKLRQLSEMLLSPYVYEMVSGHLADIELCSRDIDYNKHGEISTLSIDVLSSWKGGHI